MTTLPQTGRSNRGWILDAALFAKPKQRGDAYTMVTMRNLLLILALLASLLSTSEAKSWCAHPLTVHEWGVQIFDAGGAVQGRGSAVASLPPFFFSRPNPQASAAARVSDLPPDGGQRDLPILHFTAPKTDDRVPLGLGIGFAAGAATRWYPQVDTFRPELAANSPEAQALRRGLLLGRRQLKPFGDRPRLPDDPTRQLEYRSLLLTRDPLRAPQATDIHWVQQARALTDALWVNAAQETERFVFFEGKTRERVALSLARGTSYTDKHRHFVLTNTSAFPVHDVFVIHREGDALFVFNAPAIPAGATAGFVLEEHRVVDAQRSARTIAALRRQLVASPSEDHSCVMGRDPAIPVESAGGYSLFADEADTLLGVWASAFFDQRGTTILYREDPGYLDRMMPLALFTDMFHYVELHRAGLALWQGVVLP